ncbi:MAG: penicillin-binding protein 2 [bacterium]
MKHKRLTLAFISMFMLYVLLSFRLYYLQIWKRAELSYKAKKQWMKVSHTKPLKSSIYDRKGRLLAFSSYADSFFVNPKKLENVKSTMKKVCEILELDEAQYINSVRDSTKSFIWLKRMVEQSKAEKLKLENLKGIGCIKERKRYYPEDGLASPLLGIVGLDDKPLSGIELTVSNIFKTHGEEKVFGRDAKGRMINWDGAISDEMSNGSVYLTIDKTIQYIAEKELSSVFESTKSKWGCAIVQDISTGEILAMAMCPKFSNNSPQDIQQVSQLHNLAIGQVFEPGSTFKIVTAAAALEEKICDMNTMFNCHNGKYTIMANTIHDHEPRGMLNFKQVFEYSSNIGVAQIGELVGKKKTYYYARAFGFGNRTGIKLPGESSGILRKPKYWSKISLPMISFGQEVGVTSIQVLCAYSAIANQGVLLEPKIIKRVVDEKNNILWESNPTKVRNIISKATAENLKKILEGVIKTGTGTMAQVSGYRIAGKTGTAQKFDKELDRYSDRNYVASFCGFLPSSRPKIAIIVVLDEPKTSYWGGVIAAPVFSRIARQVVSYMNILPDEVDYVDNVIIKEKPDKT